MSEEQEESANIPKPPFEAAPPARSEPAPPQRAESGPEEPEPDGPRITRGFGGRGASAREEPEAQEPSSPQELPVPPPPFAVSGPAPAGAPVGEREPSAPLFPTPPFESAQPRLPAPLGPENGPGTGDEPSSPPRAGSISFQEPGSTQVRQPTLAESRARYQAEQEAVRQREIEELYEENKRTWRRRLIGGAAVVGLVGVVALVYLASPEQRCYDDASHNEVPSYYCTSSYHPGGGVYIFHNSGWFGSSSYSGGRFGGGYSSGGGSPGSSSDSDKGSVQRGGINPSGKGSSST